MHFALRGLKGDLLFHNLKILVLQNYLSSYYFLDIGKILPHGKWKSSTEFVVVLLVVHC